MTYDATLYVKDPDTRYGVLGFMENCLGIPITGGGISKSRYDDEGNLVVDRIPYEYVSINEVIGYHNGVGSYGSISMGGDTETDILRRMQEDTEDHNARIGDPNTPWVKNRCINCGTNIKRFKFIVQMKDGTDYGAPVVWTYKDGHEELQINKQYKDIEKDVDGPWKGRIKKATIEDVMRLTEPLANEKGPALHEGDYVKISCDGDERDGESGYVSSILVKYGYVVSIPEKSIARGPYKDNQLKITAKPEKTCRSAKISINKNGIFQ